VDALLVIVCFCCAIAGMFWGAVRMTATVLAAVGAVVAVRFAGPPAAMLLAGGEPGTMTRVVAAALVAVLTAGLVLLAGRGLRKGLEAIKLGWLDRIVGGLLAAAVALVISTLLLALAAAGGYGPQGRWSRGLAVFGQTALELQSRPTSSASPSSTPSTPTTNGQQPN